MKKRITLLFVPFLFFVANDLAAQRQIIHPSYDVKTSGIPTITKIELTDTSTRLFVHCTYVPGNWIAFSDKTFIRKAPDGEKLFMTAMKGGEPGARITMPPSGDTAVVLTFPPLEPGVESIHYGEGDNVLIYDLSLTEQAEIVPGGKQLPDSIAQWIESKLAAARVKELVDYNTPGFFRKDTAKLVGYLRGYDPRLGFSSGIIYMENALTREDFPIVVPIDPNGRFEAALPMSHPLYTGLILDKKWIRFYVEPGQTLAMVLDWETLLKAGWRNEDRFHVRPVEFRGPAARINSELAAIRIKRPSYDQMTERSKTLTPAEFREVHLAAWKARQAELGDTLAANDFLPQTETILRNELALIYATLMYDFNGRRDYERKQDSLNQVLKVNVKPAFFDFLQTMPLDDQTLLISSEFSTFVNRFEYGDAFLKAYSLAYKKKTPSAADQALFVWKMRDSILESYYNLRPGLVYEISKTRSLKSYFQQVFDGKKDQARVFLTALEKGISNPFLQMEAERYFRKAYPPVPRAAYTLPPGKATDIFERLVAPHKGKVLFVDFWATTCGPCVASIRHHKSSRQKYRGNPDFDFIFITSAEQSPESSYNKFVGEQELQHTYRLSTDDFRYLRQLFKFNGIPRYVLVGKDGSILNDDFSMYNFEYELKKLFPAYAIAEK